MKIVNCLTKLLLFTCIGMFSFTALDVCAGATEAEKYIYISASAGSDQNNGASPEKAVKTLNRAMLAAITSNAERAVIVFTDEYNLTQTHTEIVHKFPITYTTNDGKVDYGARGAKLRFGTALRFFLNGDSTFENIKIEYSGTLNFVAQYNPITFGKGVCTARTDSDSCDVYVVGGWQNPMASKDVTLDSHITIDSGNFYTVVGGTRQSGDGKELTFTGTHHITVNGGEIGILYGGSVANHKSQNAVIAVNGGKIDALRIAGDEDRILNGTASLTLSGGEIGNVYAYNVIRDLDVALLGTRVGGMTVSYTTTSIDTLRRAANRPKTLRYNVKYTDSEIAGFTGFTSVRNETIVYAREGANGSGQRDSDPTSFANAMQMVAKSGGTIEVLGKLQLCDYIEPQHSKKITVVGVADGRIEISGTYTLSGETEFADITLEGKGTLDATAGVFATADSVRIASDTELTIQGSADLAGGSFVSIRDAKTVRINGARVDTVVGGKTETHIEMLGGSIGSLQTTNTDIRVFTLTIHGGSIGKVTFKNVTDRLQYGIDGGNVSAYATEGKNVQGTLMTDESKYPATSLGAAASLFAVSHKQVFFLRDGATGSGKHALDASSSISAAYTALKENGGTLVICGPYTLKTPTLNFQNKQAITITSLYGGVDYAARNGAEIIFQTNFFCGGDTEFQNITLTADSRYLSIYGNCHKLVLGENIRSNKHVGSGTYLSVMGANQSAVQNHTTDLTFRSGKWQRVRGGTANSGRNLTVNLLIEGGEFYESLILGSSASHSGDIHAVIRGGSLYQGIYASTLSSAEHSFNAKVSLLIEGGTVYGVIAPARATVSQYFGSYDGSFDVVLLGGNFDHLTELVGTGKNAKGMKSSLQIAEHIDLQKEVSGTMTFTNPIRANGADPWLFYLDGYYYYTATTGSTLGIARATNIGDLPYAEYVTVYDPEDGTMWSRNLWSPEIHYYSDEEIGKGNGGWYCYIACDNGDNIYHRMYVIKCLDGNNLFGRWGNPVTGEVNVPQKIEAKDIPDFDNFHRVLDIPVCHLRNVHKSVLVNADVHKSSKINNVSYRSHKLHSCGEVFKLHNVAASHKRLRKLISRITSRLLKLLYNVFKRRNADTDFVRKLDKPCLFGLFCKLRKRSRVNIRKCITAFFKKCLCGVVAFGVNACVVKNILAFGNS